MFVSMLTFELFIRRARPVGLVDYEDDDDDEDYNPPSRKPSPSTEDDESLNIPITKRKSPCTVDGKHGELESPKKAKIETHKKSSADSRVSIAPITSARDSQSKQALSPSSSVQNREANSEPEKDTASPKNCEHTPPEEDTEDRKSNGEECPTAISNSSLERVVDASKATGSEPYSVR